MHEWLGVEDEGTRDRTGILTSYPGFQSSCADIGASRVARSSIAFDLVWQDQTGQVQTSDF